MNKPDTIDDLLETIACSMFEAWEDKHPKSRKLMEMNERYKKLFKIERRRNSIYRAGMVVLIFTGTVLIFGPLLGVYCRALPYMDFYEHSKLHQFIELCIPLLVGLALIKCALVFETLILASIDDIRREITCIRRDLESFRHMVEMLSPRKPSF